MKDEVDRSCWKGYIIYDILVFFFSSFSSMNKSSLCILNYIPLTADTMVGKAAHDCVLVGGSLASFYNIDGINV